MITEYFMPDYMFDSVYDISADFLLSIGKSVLISDIDDTLATYAENEPSEELCKWIASLRQRGILIAFASNNSKKRVDRFNQRLGFFAMHKIKKPSKRAVMRTMKHFHVLKDQICFLGDQLFTDVWAAKRAGVTSILVKPIGKPRNAFFRFKRSLEAPLVKRFSKLKKVRSQNIT